MVCVRGERERKMKVNVVKCKHLVNVGKEYAGNLGTILATFL